MGVCHNMGVHSVGVHGGKPIPLIDVLYLVIRDHLAACEECGV